MTGQSNTKDKRSRESKPWLSDFIFCLVCGLLVGIFTWFADTSAPFQTVFSKANEDNYNLLVQGFSAGQLNLKEDAPPGLAKLSDPYDPKILRTLAAAYAEMGKFTEASSTAKQALALAQTQSDKSLTTALQTDIRDYQAHIPLRSTADF